MNEIIYSYIMFSLFHPQVDVELKVPEEKHDIDYEIDWKIIDQLHNAVINFSRNSMQTKRIMFTLLGIFVAAILQLSSLEDAVKWFPFIIVIVALFWAFDSFTYYYQEKLRAKMDERFESLKKRYSHSNRSDEYTLPDKRKSKCRVFRSIFNWSIVFYPSIIVMISVLWFMINHCNKV